MRKIKQGRAYAAEWSDTVLAGKMADLYRQVVSRYVRQNAQDLDLLSL